MAITISEYDEPARFKSKHWVHSRTGDNRELIIITGIVLTDFKGEGSNWKRDTVHLIIRFPNLIPAGQALQVEQWAPFITINAIYNKSHAVNAGWAVDEFGGPGVVQITDHFSLWANVAIRDIDGWLYRVGYSVTLQGRFVEYEPPPVR